MSERLKRERIKWSARASNGGDTYVTGCERHFLLNPIIQRRSVFQFHTPACSLARSLLNMRAIIRTYGGTTAPRRAK